MAKPESKDSVAQLLEQLLAVAKQQLAVAQETLQNTQATNSTLDSISATDQEILASSKRIEVLLGGEEAGVPTLLRVTYAKILRIMKEEAKGELQK
jgi:hypothetical protein